MEESTRLNKYIAEAGICSRREADKWIEKGRVTINGRVAAMGERVKSHDVVTVNGKKIKGKNDKVVLAFYKPIGVTCTEKDKFAEKTIIEYIKYPIRVTYAGRLDKDSEGLILLTNDGDLIQRLMKAGAYHEKEYVVKVDKEITPEFTRSMSEGLYLHELKRETRPCEVKQLGKYTFRIILTQGLNRQIRRMCGELGFEVKSLKRIRVCNVNLGDLAYGKLRQIEGEELEQLYRLSYAKN